MPSAAESRPLRSHWPAVALALASAVVAVLAKEHLFPGLSWNRDEPVYLWHVDVLRHGQLTATDGGHPDLFLPWLSARGDGSMFTQYTLGWPLVLLAARLVSGTSATALPVGAALAVVGTYALGYELSQRRRTATIAGGLLIASPLLAIQGGAYLSYLFTLGLGCCAGALVLSGWRLARPMRFLGAGAVLGWVFLTRPFDALLWGGAFAGSLLLTEWRRRREVVRAVTLVVTAALPLVAATLVYNRHVTGDLLTFPITAADPLDGFGFGDRRLMPGFETVDYDLATALRATAKNAVVMPWFLVGGYLGLVLAGVGLWMRRRDRLVATCLLVAAAFPIGYFPFWGTHLSSLASRISGPIYLIPLYASVCILAAVALDHWWSRSRLQQLAIVAVLVVTTLPGAITRFDVNRDISQAQTAWRTSVADLAGPAIVFVADTSTYLLYTNPFSSNPPDLDGEILYAVAGSPAMLDLIAEQPDRVPYLQQGSIASPELGPREDPYDLDVALLPVVVHRGPDLTLSVTVSPPPGTSHVAITVTTGAATSQRTLDASGSVTLELRLGHDGGTKATSPLGVLARGTVAVAVGFGDTPAEAEGAPTVQQLIPYRVAGQALEMVLPAAAQRLTLVDDELEWRHVPVLAELQVAVSPAQVP
ncbi:MAG: hypothetical protein ACRDYW_10985 [Acidimicrobiales bacterium]